MADLKEKLKLLPEKSGCYIMYDADRNILYIGKAKVLKNRVKQYFQKQANRTQKVSTLMSKVVDFDYIITNNEIEALVLENNLIKKHKPPYNILLKDDKEYPFIKINLKKKFPKPEVCRRLVADGSKYFGPYMVGISAREIQDLISAAFGLRTCNLDMDKIPKNHRPCLNFHIGRCKAPCSGNVSEQEYMDTVKKMTDFLGGNDKEIKSELEEKMKEAADREEFELALYYKEKLKVLDKLVRQQIANVPKDLNIDVIALASSGFHSVVSVLMVRGGKLLGGDKFVLDEVNLSLNGAFESFLMQYYSSSQIQTDEIIVNTDTENLGEIESYLSKLKGKKVNIVNPHQGIRKQLCDMAYSNATDYLVKSQSEEKRKYNMTQGALNQLKDNLSLKKIPERMECYDISHISGTDKVASMVVFTNGKADKNMYRRFKIKTVAGNNDFECMKEVLVRRFERFKKGEDISFKKMPDLIVVDGGKGQLKYALEALNEEGIDSEIISLAKRYEEVYMPRSEKPFILPIDSEGIKLLQRIRDEAHRFAITYHRKLRLDRQTASELTKIKGIGKERAKKLFGVFKNIENIKKASVEELILKGKLTAPIALNVFNHFNDKK